ncbi:unnamed protein product [Rotaria sordida]|uniref:CCDC113/CCDC96 coiled-coil domain-containing protein n=1 Tax=Rotaria sordida TaxID=392033 RepID=A0A813UNJ1_9BILA|nr:unnamed protein product [Rotaria sordida]CAF3658139.1 unnamed protein product [Rotaria sordida]
MSNDMLHRQEMSKNIAAIIDGYVNTIYNEHEKEDISNLSIPIIQKKLKKINEQLIFLHAENRLLYNYLIWYEKKIILNQDQEKKNSNHNLLSNENKPFLHQILKHKIKQPLSIQKKREIAETTFKVLLAYSQKYGINTTQYVDECINTMETDDETIDYLELELITLKKFIQKIDENLYDTQKKFTTEELFAFVHDRIRYRDALNERKRQKTVRLRFHIDGIEKSLRKIRQLVDTVTEVDFEQLKIDIEKQLKELNMKNKMLIFYKRQQSEANMKLNAKKPELFKEIRTLTSIRNEINSTIQQLNHYNEVKRKMQDEIIEYEKINDPLHEMIISYRVPSINNYVDLKSKQINLYRQIHAWERKVEIAERELHLRQIESINYPEKIIHPWKYLQNPSSILFYKRYKLSNNQTNEQNEIHTTTTTIVKNKLNISLPKLNNKSTISIGM